MTERWEVREGDALEVLRGMPEASIDALVTDPPAGISFMNRAWDGMRGGRAQWVAWLAEVMREALRAMKPGAHGLVWALPRTSHWTGTAMEDAGFEVRDRISHFFASGFPKSRDVSKAIDEEVGATRPVVGRHPSPASSAAMAGAVSMGADCQPAPMLTAPATEEAARWAGWGTALKPSVEDWWLVRKPLDGTVAGNVVRHGTGAVNVDACRVPLVGERVHEVESDPATLRGVGLGVTPGANRTAEEMRRAQAESIARTNSLGRWPAHLALSHGAGCVRVGTRTVKASDARRADGTVSAALGANGIYRGGNDDGSVVKNHGYGGEHGTEDVEEWRCAEDCPVRMLDEQSGAVGGAAPVRGTEPTASGFSGAVLGTAPGTRTSPAPFYGDVGAASRFFFVAKPSSAERDAGLDDLRKRDPGELTGRVAGRPGTTNPRAGARASASGGRRNVHPTVKPVALMRWLVRMITPPGGLVLDPFAGSGTTGCAALLEGFRFLGVEREAEYLPILEARLRYAAQRPVGGEYVTGERDDVLPGQLKLL